MLFGIKSAKPRAFSAIPTEHNSPGSPDFPVISKALFSNVSQARSGRLTSHTLLHHLAERLRHCVLLALTLFSPKSHKSSSSCGPRLKAAHYAYEGPVVRHQIRSAVLR